MRLTQATGIRFQQRLETTALSIVIQYSVNYDYAGLPDFYSDQIGFSSDPSSGRLESLVLLWKGKLNVLPIPFAEVNIKMFI